MGYLTIGFEVLPWRFSVPLLTAWKPRPDGRKNELRNLLVSRLVQLHWPFSFYFFLPSSPLALPLWVISLLLHTFTTTIMWFCGGATAFAVRLVCQPEYLTDWSLHKSRKFCLSLKDEAWREKIKKKPKRCWGICNSDSKNFVHA